MFWLQSWNHLILLYAPVIKNVIWLHLAQVAYLPQRVKMIWCSSWIKSVRCSLYVTGCGRGLLRKQDTCRHNTRFTSNGLRCALTPQPCPNFRPWGIWTLSRRLTFSTLHISHTWQCVHLRKAKIGWPATQDAAGRVPELYVYSPKGEQINMNDLVLSEQALQMSLD